jgi:3-oxoacyl-[acyl-carrier protein] reductase
MTSAQTPAEGRRDGPPTLTKYELGTHAITPKGSRGPYYWCKPSTRIGFAIAQRLAAFGADLCVHAYSAYDAEQPWGADVDGALALTNELRQYGGKVVPIESDLCEASEPERVVDAAASAFGHLDIVVVNHAHSTLGELEHLTASHIDRHLIVNVRASLLLIKAFSARHDGREGGRVVLMTSGQHLGPMQTELAYAASKGALHQITLSLAAKLAARRITVNTINPGATDTGYATPEVYEAVRASEPMGRWGTPMDAARLIGWLVTDEGLWITGQVLNSTGGFVRPVR